MDCASLRALPADQDGLAHRLGRQTEPAPPHEYSTLAKYNDHPDEQRYQFVVMPPGQSIHTTLLRVRLRRQAGLSSHLDDVPYSEFFGYDPTGFSDDEAEEGEGGPLSYFNPHGYPLTPFAPAEAASTSAGLAVEEAEVVVEEPKPKGCG